MIGEVNLTSGGPCVLKKAWTKQRHGPTWSVANVRTDMVRNSEQCLVATTKLKTYLICRWDGVLLTKFVR